jgi:hypothetical protein
MVDVRADLSPMPESLEFEVSEPAIRVETTLVLFNEVQLLRVQLQSDVKPN